MELSTSTNMVAFQPGRMRNSMEFCIKTCAEGGYRVLDINFCEALNPWSRMREKDWESYVLELKSLAHRLGVTFRQAHLPYYDVFRTGKPDPVMEELIRRSIRACAMLGVRWAVTHPGTLYTHGADSGACLAANVGYYAEHLALARECGIGICLENDFGFLPGQPEKRLYCADIRELVELVDAFQDPEHMGVCYDFGHGNLCEGVCHRENILLIGHRLRALHVQDNLGKEDSHLLPFHGNINWNEAMAALAEIGYRGDLTFEVQEFGRYLPNDQKHLVVDYSQKIGKILLDMFEKAKKTWG